MLNKDWENQEEEQYFPHDIHLSKGYGRFVDCGSYVGDTLERLVVKEDVQAIVAFEPGRFNYNLLKKSLENIAIEEKKCYQYAVGEKEQYVSFNDDLGDGSCCVSENIEGDMIKMVALDHCIPDFNPTMIKMDIEGSEIDAIKGAKNLITRNQPDLAICVYHQFNHLWKISCLLHEICPQYKFYLRCYGFEGGETVLYATV